MCYLKLFIYSLVSIFLIPHIILYLLSTNKQLIEKDVNVNYKGDDYFIYKLICLLIRNKYFRCLFYYRIGNSSVFIKWLFPAESTFMISKSTKIDSDVYIAHPYATVINAKSIGKHLSIRQCTTIGNKIDGRNDLVPIIGDNVTIGANVVIIGDVKIGNNVTIGAGSVVVKDIPDNCIIAGNPCRIIKYFD